MNTSTQAGFGQLALPDSAPAAARAVFRLLKNLKHGSFDVQMPDGSHARFGSAAGGDLRAAIRLRNWNVCSAALKSGDIGFAESFIAGDWTTPDLAALLKLFIANRDEIESVVYGTWWGSLLYRAKHLFNRNSRSGSKKNIHAHYDLGNEFYRLWLDPTMNYSSAWFEGDRSRSMVDAQWAKVWRALSECGTKPGDRVLEIGCGWGALAECAGREFGAHVTGVTLSHEQLAWGQQRLVEPNSGLGKALRYLLKHWQELTLFLRKAGAPLDNNLCEQILKRAILHRKGSMFYKTVTGAETGDIYMSLIHTCRLCDVNPFDYLNALQQRAQEVIDAPARWLPWNFREQLAGAP